LDANSSRIRQPQPSLGKLIGGHCGARGAYQLIRLFQNVGICRLFSRKKAEHHKRRAKYQAYEHNFPIGAFVRTVKRTRHKSPATKRYSYRATIALNVRHRGAPKVQIGPQGTRRAIARGKPGKCSPQIPDSPAAFLESWRGYRGQSSPAIHAARLPSASLRKLKIRATV
jgi:hypothetical protein